MDYLTGRRLLERSFGWAWPVPFAAGYLLLAGTMVMAWIAAPSPTLLCFLLLSAVHFGAGDVGSSLYPRAAVGLAVLLRGLLPVAGPILGHPDETAELFSWLLPRRDAGAVASLVDAFGARVGPWLVGGWAIMAGAHLVAGCRAHRGHLGAALEIVALMALFWFLPPLVAFGIYFCGWHSVRHGLRQASEIDPLSASRGLLGYALRALPLTVAALALAAPAYWMLARTTTAPLALAQTLFVGLAALTLPHMALHGLYRLRS
jgi:Brp/Blh family beta-carotene 15,15'-monooxygenase